jgi:hypothetical protein
MTNRQRIARGSFNSARLTLDTNFLCGDSEPESSGVQSIRGVMPSRRSDA